MQKLLANFCPSVSRFSPWYPVTISGVPVWLPYGCAMVTVRYDTATIVQPYANLTYGAEIVPGYPPDNAKIDSSRRQKK